MPKTASIVFTGSQMRALGGNVVYVIWKGSAALYIGVSRCGLSRPFSAVHTSAQIAMRTADRMEIFTHPDTASAVNHEISLIETLRPKNNKRPGGHTHYQSHVAPIVDGRIYNLRIEDALMNEAFEYARNEHMSLGALIRMAVRAFIAPLEVIPGKKAGKRGK